jgi:small conductance mechanosensitive channel
MPTPAGVGVESNEVQWLIDTLEDEKARAKLVEQLRLMTQAQAAATEGAPPANPLAAALQSVSERLAQAATGLNRLAGDIIQLPAATGRLVEQWQDPERRVIWIKGLTHLLLVLGLAYLASVLLRWTLSGPSRLMTRRTPRSAGHQLFWLTASFLLELVPLLGFVVVAYVTLGVLRTGEQLRLVALAWVNASIVSRLLMMVTRFALAPAAGGLRLLRLEDETAHYLEIWMRRLGVTSVYGYFALQAGVLLGLSAGAYAAWLRLLGVVVATFFMVFIMQNRREVATWLRRPTGPEGRGRTLRSRLAPVWHWLAIAYTLLLLASWLVRAEGGFGFLLQATGFSVVSVVLGLVTLRLLSQFLRRGFGIGKALELRFPLLEARANRYLPYIQRGLAVLVYAVVFLAVLQSWGLGTFAWFYEGAGRVLGIGLLKIVVIVCVAVAIWEIVSVWVEGYLAEKDHDGNVQVRTARTRTLLGVARRALLVALSVVTTLMVLTEVGMSITPLLTAAGVLGLAVGFGAQKLVQDVITGVFILLEDLFVVGDVIKVGETAGLVEAISIRNVRLRDFGGVVHTIPFSAINTVSNLTKEFSYYVFDVGVAYRENVDEVMEVMKQVGAELQGDAEVGPLILAPLEVVGVDRFADSAVVIKARIKTLPIKQWSVGRAYNRRLKIRFDELGIEIPFPHQTVYFGSDKDGTAPAARLEIHSTPPPPAPSGSS